MSGKYPNSSGRTGPTNTIFTDLSPISPDEAIEMYLDDRSRELRESSLATHRSALKFFSKWCKEQAIENLNNLDGRLLRKFRLWRRDDGTKKVDQLSISAEKTQQKIVRLFIQYCESIEAVPPGLHEKVKIPSVPGDTSREKIVDHEQATTILEHLDKFEYADTSHVVWVLLTSTGIRKGTLRAIDLDDLHFDEEIPHVKIRNRPEQGTGLKNGDRGERDLALSAYPRTVLEEYIRTTRPDEEDEYGRKPLLTAGQGRLSGSTIRKYAYMWSRPCSVGDDCPHGRDPKSCEATPDSSASKCPSSEGTHAIRRGHITHELSSGLSDTYLCERCDVTKPVIDQHYDKRSKQEKMEARVNARQETHRSNDPYGGE